MILISHKGVGDENTIPAIISAFDKGYNGIEFDIQSTIDNILVLSHDNNLLKNTGKDILISETTIGDLSNIKTLDGNSIPTLVETLETIKDGNRFVVLDPKTMNAFRLCLIFFEKNNYDNLKIVLGHPVITLNWKCISINTGEQYYKPPWYIQIFMKYPNSLVWTVNDKPLFNILKKLGVYGIITDNIL